MEKKDPHKKSSYTDPEKGTRKYKTKSHAQAQKTLTQTPQEREREIETLTNIERNKHGNTVSHASVDPLHKHIERQRV